MTDIRTPVNLLRDRVFAMLVRPATPDDCPAVLEIVNREIREGVAHFATTEHTLAEIESWVASNATLPFFAAEVGGQMLGYARAARWKDRQAYDWATEVGVYVARGAQGRGVGRDLYKALIPALQRAGYHSIIAGIALPNPASVRLHEAFEMRHVGTFPRVGYKLGRWIDVGYWVWSRGDGPPHPIIPCA